jgi:hypothetical protein
LILLPDKTSDGTAMIKEKNKRDLVKQSERWKKHQNWNGLG